MKQFFGVTRCFLKNTQKINIKNIIIIKINIMKVFYWFDTLYSIDVDRPKDIFIYLPSFFLLYFIRTYLIANRIIVINLQKEINFIYFISFLMRKIN